MLRIICTLHDINRDNYAVDFQHLTRDVNDFLNHHTMSDETHFHLNGFAITQNAIV